MQGYITQELSPGTEVINVCALYFQYIHILQSDQPGNGNDNTYVTSFHS